MTGGDDVLVRDGSREERTSVNRSRRNVELIDLIVDDGDCQDEDFRRPTKPGWVWALVVGAVAIVVLGGVITGGSNQVPSSSRTTAGQVTVTSATTPAVKSPPMSISQPSAVHPDTTPASSGSGSGLVHVLTDVGGPVRPFGRDTGLAVYLAPSGRAQDKLFVYDIDRGRITEVDLGRDIGWFVRAFAIMGGVLVDSGDVLRVTATEVNAIPLATTGNFSYIDAPNGRLAPGPEQGTWLRTSSPSGLVLLDETGNATGVGYPLPADAVSNGSLADGRPVVRSADQRSLVIDNDAQYVPLASGPTSIVEHGRFIETVCHESLRCSYIAHVDATVRVLGPVTTGTDTTVSYRFQPDGPLIALVRDRELSILDVDTGELRANLLSGIVDLGFGGNGPSNNELLTSSIVFLPGGTGLVAATQFGIQLLDLAGHVLTTVDLPSSADGTQAPLLLGIGLASDLTDG